MNTYQLLNLNSILTKFSDHCQKVIFGNDEEKESLILHLSETCLKEIINNCNWVNECEIVLIEEPRIRLVNKLPAMISCMMDAFSEDDEMFLEINGIRLENLTALQTSLVMFQSAYMHSVIEPITEELLSTEAMMSNLYLYTKNGTSSTITRATV